jgi:hypothetical protein
MCIDTPESLGLSNPADHNSGVKVTIEMPTFTCQECGNEFPPKMSKGEIIDLTCKCGWSGNDALEECTTDELIGR